MLDWPNFASLLAIYAKSAAVRPDDVLFRSGLDMSSIRFAEFILELEDQAGVEIDIDDLDASIETAGQLFQRLGSVA